MSSFDRPHESPSPPSLSGEVTAWSAPIGSFGGIPVRVHLSLAVALVLAVGACIGFGSATGWLTLAVYLVSLFVHEAAHVAAAGPRVVSGVNREGDAVVLGPFGGLRVLGVDADPRERVFVAMAGPLASLAIVVGAMFFLANDSESGRRLLGDLLTKPYATLTAGGIVGATPMATLAPLMVAINWPLFLLNLAPASPFDGGVALRAWLRVWLGRQPARDAACFIALLIAAGLLGAGAALVLTDAAPALVGAGLATLAVVIAYGARVDAVTEATFRETASDGHGLRDGLNHGGRFPRSVSLAPVTIRLHEREDATADNDPAEEESVETYSEEDRVDDILAKVHLNGVEGLTANERGILERASQRYQRRRKSSD